MDARTRWWNRAGETPSGRVFGQSAAFRDGRPGDVGTSD